MLLDLTHVRVAFVCLALFVSLSVEAQPAADGFVVEGTVTDGETGVPLVGATVVSVASGRGTSTRPDGAFRLSVTRSPDVLRVSYVGYGAVELAVGQAQAGVGPVEIELLPTWSALGTVSVEAAPETAVEAVWSGASRVSAEDVRAMPQVLGEPDALKTLQLLPGVRAGKEGTAGLHVRGSGPGQNLVLLDGLPLYGTTHLFGFFSAFPTEALSDVVALRSAFPARYAGRLASVVDLRTRPGSSERTGVQASVGLLSSQVVVEGPILGGLTGLVAVRRTYLDLFTRALAPPGGYSLDPYFGDAYARVDAPLGPLTATFSGYASRDAFAFEDPGVSQSEAGRVGWANALGSARVRGAVGPVAVEGGIGAVTYDLDMEQSVEHSDPDGGEVDRFESSYGSEARDVRAWAQGASRTPWGSTVEVGGSWTAHRYTPAVTRVTTTATSGADTTAAGAPSSSVEAGVYAEHDTEVGPVRLSVGAHVGYYESGGFVDVSVQPRVAARLRLGDYAVKGSYASSSQPVHLLTNGALGLPTELWLPATPMAPVATARQWSLGGVYAPAGSAWAVTVDGYVKRERGLVEYLDGASFADASAGRWEDVVALGDGRSVGLEVLVERQRGRLTGWLGYTLSRTTRSFPDLDGGTPFTASSDRTHDVSLVGRYRLRPGLSLQGSWVYTTGQAVTLPVGDFYSCWDGGAGLETPCGVYAAYGPRNGARLPAYHRLDVAARLEWRDGRVAFSAGLTNAYNARNPFNVTGTGGGATSFFGREYDERYLRGVTLFPVLPFARLDLRF